MHRLEDKGGVATNYLAVVGAGTPWEPGRALTWEMLRANSNHTIRVVENVGSDICWMEPRDLDLKTMSMSLSDNPPNGISSWLAPPAVVMVDGSVRSLDMELTAEQIRDMLLIDGSDSLPPGTTELEDGRTRPIRRPD